MYGEGYRKSSEITWNDECHCGKLFKDHINNDLHDCELTGDENQKGLKRIPKSISNRLKKE